MTLTPESSTCQEAILDLGQSAGFRTRTCGIAELRQIFDETGVLVFPGFFSPGKLETIRIETRRHFQPLAANALEKAREMRDRRAFACDIISWDPIADGNAAFRTLENDTRLRRVTEAMLGPGYTVPGSLVMYSVGGGNGQAWHQDCPADDRAAFNLNRLIYIDDVQLEDGAIVVVPGSHRAGRIPPGGHQDPIDGEIVVTPPEGTLILLNGHVYHRVTPNLQMNPRVSINFRAFPAGVSPAVTCIGIYRNGDVNFCDKPKMHDGTPAEDVVHKAAIGS